VGLHWRWLAVCGAVPPALLIVGMCFMPETPRYLLSRGKRREAEAALRFLRGPDAPVEWECARIEESCGQQVTSRDPIVPLTSRPSLRVSECRPQNPYSVGLQSPVLCSSGTL